MSAYIKYKIKSVKGKIILMSLLTAIFAEGMLMSVYVSGGYKGSTFFRSAIINSRGNMDIYLYILALFLGVSLMSPCRSQAEQILPYKNKARYLVSYLLGFIMILIQWMTVTVSAVIHYCRYAGIYHELNLASSFYDVLVREDSLGSGLLIIAELYLMCLGVFTIAAFFTVIAKRNIATWLCILGSIIFPYYILGMLTDVIQRYWNVSINFKNIIEKYAGLLESASGFTSRYEDGSVIIFLSDVDKHCMGMFIMIIVYIILGYIALKGFDGTSGKIMITGTLDRVFALVVGVYVAFLVPNMAYFKNISLVILLLVMGVISAVVYFLIMAFVKNGRKYSYLNKGGAVDDEV